MNMVSGANQAPSNVANSSSIPKNISSGAWALARGTGTGIGMAFGGWEIPDSFKSSTSPRWGVALSSFGNILKTGIYIRTVVASLSGFLADWTLLMRQNSGETTEGNPILTAASMKQHALSFSLASAQLAAVIFMPFSPLTQAITSTAGTIAATSMSGVSMMNKELFTNLPEGKEDSYILRIIDRLGGQGALDKLSKDNTTGTSLFWYAFAHELEKRAEEQYGFKKPRLYFEDFDSNPYAERAKYSTLAKGIVDFIS